MDGEQGKVFLRVGVLTKINLLFLAGIILACVLYYTITGKTYLQLGISWIGFGIFGIGLFQSKILLSSIITFFFTFTLSYYFLAEKQKRDTLFSLLLSILITLSGAYIFEFFYLWLNHHALVNYITRFSWWFNLLAGLILGIVSKSFKVNKISVGFYISFVLLMSVWYFGGYPQLVNRETPRYLFTNYINLPLTLALPLNIAAKLCSCLATVFLLNKGRQTQSEIA